MRTQNSSSIVFFLLVGLLHSLPDWLAQTNYFLICLFNYLFICLLLAFPNKLGTINPPFHGLCFVRLSFTLLSVSINILASDFSYACCFNTLKHCLLESPHMRRTFIFVRFLFSVSPDRQTDSDLESCRPPVTKEMLLCEMFLYISLS